VKVTHELGVCSINQAKFDHVVNTQILTDGQLLVGQSGLCMMALR
jgi:hypothetical protein